MKSSVNRLVAQFPHEPSSRPPSRRRNQVTDSRLTSDVADALSKVGRPSAAIEVEQFTCEKYREFQLFENLSASTLIALRQHTKLVSYIRGQTICGQGDAGNTMFIVTAGRVKVTSGTGSDERVLGILDRDEHFGEMSVLTGKERTANVIAVTDACLLEIDRVGFDLLRENEPTFSKLISETLAHRLACSVHNDEPSNRSRTVGLLSSSRLGHHLAFQLREEFLAYGFDVGVLLFENKTTHISSDWHRDQVPETHLSTNPAELDQLCEQFDRVLVLDVIAAAAEHCELIAQCDHVVCFIDGETGPAALAHLGDLLERCPKLAPRIHLVWLLDEGQRFASPESRNFTTTGRDFKVIVPNAGMSSVTRQGLRRIARFLLDQRIGIALGGGGARGLAHLGVLRALADEGVEVDSVSGTSMGALVGLGYASGWDPREAETLFRQSLTPGWFFRMLPRGKSWYMIAKFRFKAWENMLRNFFQHSTFEQLQLPFCTVSADLLSGEQVVRERGDCVNAILESINLPYISKPILRDGQVLVDGGILNNVPVDLLRPRGARTVIGVDVCSPLPQHFGRSARSVAGPQLHQPSLLETAFRLNEIRRHRVCRTDLTTADHLICIDTSNFEFEDFSQSHALAEVGYHATLASTAQIRSLVDERLKQSRKSR